MAGAPGTLAIPPLGVLLLVDRSTNYRFVSLDGVAMPRRDPVADSPLALLDSRPIRRARLGTAAMFV